MNMKMKNKGFTLIELLAVIIILGILMIIAIPSVTSYISNSRKNAYVTSIKQIAASARNMVNQGNYSMYDTDVTYYIDTSCLKTENTSKFRSPYGEIEKAYIAVTYDGSSFSYYFTGVDETGTGVEKISLVDSLEENSIVSDIKAESINSNIGIDGRGYSILIDGNCKKNEKEKVNKKINSITGEELRDKVCIRATTLHTSECTQTSSDDNCRYAGYTESGSKHTTTITYGNENTTDGVLNIGDAFDCDVDGNNMYDDDERFYYVSDLDDDTAVLIYYSNVLNQELDNKTGVQNAGYSKNGPEFGYKNLPDTTNWVNVRLKNNQRTITNEYGENKTNNNTDTIVSPFTYTGKAARYLALEDIKMIYEKKGWDKTFVNYSYTTTKGLLKDYSFFFENTSFDKSGLIGGYWLEDIKRDGDHRNIDIYALHVSVGNNRTYDRNAGRGVRPVIEVPKDSIKY